MVNDPALPVATREAIVDQMILNAQVL